MPKVGCMTEAYNHAAQIEQDLNNQRDRREGGQTSVPCVLCDKASHKTECEYFSIIKAKTTETTANEQGCSGCGERTHTISNCREMYISNQTCSRCHEAGHVAAACNAQIAKDTNKPEIQTLVSAAISSVSLTSTTKYFIKMAQPT
ncbi:unnamed protein product [Trichogramma brassicae]|uniref:CCHC-type domain-containing protein n=1 Tax=Trichogramma brassicae TaxID=86971 RepID=A0A6H5J0V6_9HYME|nr:unnamed protein product [Trichogramma brassicae]